MHLLYDIEQQPNRNTSPPALSAHQVLHKATLFMGPSLRTSHNNIKMSHYPVNCPGSWPFHRHPRIDHPIQQHPLVADSVHKR